MDKSLKRAYEILARHKSNVEVYCRDILLSVILVGSLTNGSYTGDGGSDIDLIHILRNDTSERDRERVLNLIERTEHETGTDIPIARCVYRYGALLELKPVGFPLCREYKDHLEMPIELLRIKDSGQTVWGEELMDALPTPTRENVIAFRQLELELARQLAQSGRLPEQEKLPIRLIVQSVLVRGLRDYFFATGASCSNKAKIAELMRRDVPDYAFLELMELCTRWRYVPDSFRPEEEEWINALWQQWLELTRGRAIDEVVRTSKTGGGAYETPRKMAGDL